jgi:hypothetical protein
MVRALDPSACADSFFLLRGPIRVGRMVFHDKLLASVVAEQFQAVAIRGTFSKKAGNISDQPAW